MNSQIMWQTILIEIVVAVLCLALCVGALLMLGSILAPHASHGAIMIIAHPYQSGGTL
jgi:hypothetical protein